VRFSLCGLRMHGCDHRSLASGVLDVIASSQTVLMTVGSPALVSLLRILQIKTSMILISGSCRSNSC